MRIRTERRSRMDEERQEYLSEAELDALIRQVEKQEMLRAPSYLKEEILFRMKEEPANLTLHGEMAGTNRRRDGVREEPSAERKKRELFFYSMRVSLAAAAAVVMLFALPMGGNGGDRGGYPAASEERVRPASRMMQSLSEHSTQFCKKLNSVSTWLVSEDKEWREM